MDVDVKSRTLLRVSDSATASIAAAKRNCVAVVIPGWNSREIVEVPLVVIPPAIRILLKPSFRFHARVNVGAEKKSDLQFESFEES